LLTAAAQTWNVPDGQLTTASDASDATRPSMGNGELAANAATFLRGF